MVIPVAAFPLAYPELSNLLISLFLFAHAWTFLSGSQKERFGMTYFP